MLDNRFPNPGVDTRFPSPGVDDQFPLPGVDARFVDGVDTRFEAGQTITIDTPGSLDVSTFKIGTAHTITPGTATAGAGGTISYETRWQVDGVTVIATAAYTPQVADDTLPIVAQWRAVETGGSNDTQTPWQTVGIGTVTEVTPSAASGIADQSYVEDIAITALNVAADFTGGGITYALAPSSAALPVGLSLAANGQITGTPTTPAAQVNIVVRGTNSGGFADTAFGITITEADVTAPVVSGASFNDSTDTWTFSTTEGGTLYWAIYENASGAPTLNTNGTWTGTTIETGSLAVVASGDFTPAYTASTGDRTIFGIIDAAGNVSNLTSAVFTPAVSGLQIVQTDQDFQNGGATTATVTFPGMSLGAATANRRIILAFGGFTGGTNGFSGTCGGEAFTVRAIAEDNVGGVKAHAVIATVDTDPGGTTGDVVLTANGTWNQSRSYVRVLTAQKASALTIGDTAVDNNTGGAQVLTLNTDTVAGGSVIATAFNNTSGLTEQPIWTGITEVGTDTDIDGGEWTTCAVENNVTAETPRTISVDADHVPSRHAGCALAVS